MKFLLLASLLLVSSCGKPALRNTRLVQTDQCPIPFEKSGLCAKINWKSGPSADAESAFELEFWNQDNSKPQPDVSNRLAIFLRMTCCGTIQVPKTNLLETNRFLVNQIRFAPGNWEIHVQLKGTQLEDSVVLVSLDDQ
jgi:hypothetical protein